MPTARDIMTVGQADIARALPDAKVGDLVDAISSTPANG